MTAAEIDTGTLLRIHSLFGTWTDYSAADRAEIEALSVDLLGKPVRDCPCPGRWRDAVDEMHTKFRKQIAMATVNKYAMVNGAVIEWKGKYYTHANITDEVAQAYLEKFPKRVKLFTSVPATAPAAVKEAKKAIKAAEAKTE